jgi:integrase
MARRSARAGPTVGNDNATRVELGPFWLWYRRERDEWCICWYDEGAAGRVRRTCRKSTGVGGSEDGRPPEAATDALAEHYAAWRKPVHQPVHEAGVERILADWLVEHVDKASADAERPRYSVAHWLRFFDIERRAGRLTGGPYVSDVKKAFAERFIEWRQAEGVSPATISRDLAALRSSLNWAWRDERIPSAPFVPDVPKKAEPRDLIYSPEQIARLLEAARRVPERWHVHLFIMIMLSTHGRGEAILELDAETQVRNGLIFFNAPGRQQTSKRRSVVPIAPTLAPWLVGATGKVIQYRTVKKDKATGTEQIITKPTSSIRTAFDACLVEAGICEQDTDEDGNAIWHEPRRKLGETHRRPRMVGIGSPNTLRHTISTELHTMGVPEAQIETAAGHRGEGTNKRNYRHLRPDYLKEFISGVEDFWIRVGAHTTAHLRSQCDPKVVKLATARAAARLKN